MNIRKDAHDILTATDEHLWLDIFTGCGDYPSLIRPQGDGYGDGCHYGNTRGGGLADPVQVGMNFMQLSDNYGYNSIGIQQVNPGDGTGEGN